jgi:hypothetical protein
MTPQTWHIVMPAEDTPKASRMDSWDGYIGWEGS